MPLGCTDVPCAVAGGGRGSPARPIRALVRLRLLGAGSTGQQTFRLIFIRRFRMKCRSLLSGVSQQPSAPPPYVLRARCGRDISTSSENCTTDRAGLRWLSARCRTLHLPISMLKLTAISARRRTDSGLRGMARLATCLRCSVVVSNRTIAVTPATFSAVFPS